MPNRTEVCNISTGQSIYRVAREIKKQEHSAFNCLCSIAEDAAFVNEIRVLYTDLPLVANLRCGLWYTTNPSSTPTCYFKSTDGHQNTLNFSTTRLNWHIAELAAKRGGVLIVDATRKGKRFPDAFSKTIPIWAAVINRAVARVRLHDAQKELRRRSYASTDGEVLTPVADTQTSISVRHQDISSTPTSTATAFNTARGAEREHACKAVQQEDSQSRQQWQAPQCHHAASGLAHMSKEHVEDLLVDCIADSMELLSGLTVIVQRPSTPELSPNHSSSSQHPQHQQAVSAVNDLHALAPSWVLGAPFGSTIVRSSSGLQRSLSLHISPQPSLQEWLDDTDVLHRLTAAALHHEYCVSPSSRRAARMSCHSIMGICGGSGKVETLGPAADAAHAEALFASSAPAVSCLLSALPHCGGCNRAVPSSTDAANVQPLWDPQSAAAASGFTLISTPAVEPVTPRLGCCGALPATFSNIQAAMQQTATMPAVAMPAAGHSRMSDLHRQESANAASSPSITLLQDAASTTAEFAFPAAHMLSQSSSLGHFPIECSPVSTIGVGSNSSSCHGSGLIAPNMPVVVLNGTSHQPADAASILDIWRSTDLEDVASLPGISDFMPGVYHVPERQPSAGDDMTPGSTWQQCSVSAADDEQEGKVVFQDCWDTALPAAGTASAGSPGSSSSCWVDEESQLGCDGLCAFDLLAEPAASAAAPVVGSSLRSSHKQQRPRSPSSGSSCSSDSRYSKFSCGSHTAAAAAGSDGPEVSWDTSLHLPLWVPANERQAIEAKLDGFVERLLEVGADVRGLAAQLQKPLRPLWVSQDSLIWTNQVAHPSTLPFTPLLLVSASQPHQCERQTARAAWQQPVTSSSSSAPAAGVSCDLDDMSDEEGPRGSGHMASSRAARASRSGTAGSAGKGGEDKTGLSSWSYVYIPGAGDDEESWACGLTPTLFWDHCAALLSCGPAGLPAAVKQLVQQHRNVAGAGTTACSTSSLGSRQQQHHSRAAGRKSQCHVATDQHHPAPHSCLSSRDQAASVRVMPAAPGAFWLGDTGLALGNLEGATAADVWRAVDAVLCCGSSVPAVLQQEYKAMQMSKACTAATPSTMLLSRSAPAATTLSQAEANMVAGADLCFKPRYWPCSHQASSSYSSCSDWAKQQQQQQHQPTAAVAVEGNGNLDLCKVNVSAAAVTRPKKKNGMLTELLKKDGSISQALHIQHYHIGSADSVSSCSSVNSDKAGSSSSSVELATSSDSSYSSCSEESLQAAGEDSTLTHLKWLPIESAKRNRVSLKQQLQEALEFVSAHLAAGHLVMLQDPEGHDTCVCLAVAILLGCFSASGDTAAAAAASSAASFVAVWPEGVGCADEHAGARCQPQPHTPPQPVTKHTVRQQLAYVSAAYPDARPTRGMLKQVFNFFEDRRREAAGQSVGRRRHV